MDVVFEGALSRSWGMKDVLQAVVEVPNVPNGLLRVSCPGKSIQGKILVADARHIIGATCTGSPSEDAYDSLRTMLEVTEGNFAFIDLVSETNTEFAPSLFICLDRLLTTMPELPGSGSELFDQDTLLNRVFGEDTASRQTASAQAKSREFSFAVPVPRSRAFRQSAAINNAAIKTNNLAPAPITQWNILEPLFNSPQATHTDHIDCCPSKAPEFSPPYDDQRQSMVRLRALPDRSRDFSWERLIKSQQPVKWLLAALAFSM